MAFSRSTTAFVMVCDENYPKKKKKKKKKQRCGTNVIGGPGHPCSWIVFMIVCPHVPCSDYRPVPDHQEIFFNPQQGLMVTCELLESTKAASGAALLPYILTDAMKKEGGNVIAALSQCTPPTPLTAASDAFPYVVSRVLTPQSNAPLQGLFVYNHATMLHHAWFLQQRSICHVRSTLRSTTLSFSS